MKSNSSPIAITESILFKKIVATLVPYITVGAGMLVFHNVWAAILSYHLCMAVLILLPGSGLNIKQAFGSRTYWIPLITGIIGAASGILLYWIWPLLSIEGSFALNLQTMGLSRQEWPFFITYFAIASPLLEEFYWRGYLVSPSRGIAATDLFFAGYHLIVLASFMLNFWLVAIFISLVAGAWLWRQANRINRGLTASLVSHFTADLSIILVIFYFAAG
jgi:membrane protease YdiL (CAAX protease family)